MASSWAAIRCGSRSCRTRCRSSRNRKDSPGQIRTAVARSLLGVFGRSRASNHWPATASRSRLAARPRGCERDSTERAYIDFVLLNRFGESAQHPVLLQHREKRRRAGALLGSEQDEVQVAEEPARLDRETAFLRERDHRLLNRLLVPGDRGGFRRKQTQRLTVVRVELRLHLVRERLEELHAVLRGILLRPDTRLCQAPRDSRALELGRG